MSRNRAAARAQASTRKHSGAILAAREPTLDELKEALEASEARFHAFAELGADWMWETDESFRYTWVYARGGEIFGRPAEEALGKSRLEMLTVDRTSRAWLDHVETLKRREVFCDCVLQTNVGNEVGWVSVSGSPIFDEAGGFKGYRGVAKNVTPQKRAESALTLRERCLDGIGDAVVVADAQANDAIIYVNPAFERMTGYTAQEVIGQNASIVLGPEPDASTIKEMRSTLAAGDIFRGRVLCYRKDNTPFWNEVTISAVREGGRVTHWVGIQADVTEQFKLEAQLRQAQKMEAIGALSGGIAHDFNNLLTIILGNSELLVEDLADDEMRSLAGMIQNAAARGAELTQRLLSFGRRQTLHAEPLDLNAVIEGLTEMSRRTIVEQITLRVELCGRRPVVVADRSQLETALLNLIVNARDAMPDGGMLSLKTHEVTVAAGDFGGILAPGCYPAVTVADTGIGIPPAVMERIFEPFFTTKEAGKGTGLGLAMVHGFVQQSAGHITIESEVGKGAAFTLILPRGTLDDAGAVRPSDDRKAVRGRERVLVVEDEPDVRRYVSSQLSSLGYDIVEAGTGAAALTMIAQDSTIDLLFTDVVLPEGMSGAELADLARALRPGLKILFTSGYSEDVFSRTPHGITDPMLRKPYRRHQLAEMLRTVLDGRA